MLKRKRILLNFERHTWADIFSYADHGDIIIKDKMTGNATVFMTMDIYSDIEYVVTKLSSMWEL